MEFWILLLSLVVILLGAQAFTNALEHLGERLGISEGVTGSIFAAVGTALPETMVPIVAVLGSSGALEVRHDVGVGAILGAPLMLSTLSLYHNPSRNRPVTLPHLQVRATPNNLKTFNRDFSGHQNLWLCHHFTRKPG